MHEEAGSPHALAPFARLVIALEIVLGIGALAGGLALILGPRGEILPLPLDVLEGSPFDTYLMPGLILFNVLGLGPLLAARLVWMRHPLAALGALVVGLGLLIWIAVEIAVIGYSNEPPLQAIYLALGGTITVVALRWLVAAGLPTVRHRTV